MDTIARSTGKFYKFHNILISRLHDNDLVDGVCSAQAGIIIKNVCVGPQLDPI